MREHLRESFRKVSTCENFRKSSITISNQATLHHEFAFHFRRTKSQFPISEPHIFGSNMHTGMLFCSQKSGGIV
jgi:hypothetical protein